MDNVDLFIEADSNGQLAFSFEEVEEEINWDNISDQPTFHNI
jgi:hypothetical protein